jgi:hypothetical protein
MTVQFQPGFRFSWLDLAIVIGGAAAAAAFILVEAWVTFVIAFVVGHFFLFCNVFRLARALELAWAAVFVALVAATVSTGTPGWMMTTGSSLVATIVVVILEMRKPSYHGVFWQQINPHLRQWWEIHIAQPSA